MADQKYDTLRELIRKSPHRPILTHLNADTSWLISFPIPQGRSSHRAYYHVILDPWLDGTIVVGSSWLISLTHTVTAKFLTIQDVRDVIKDIETSAASICSRPTTPASSNSNNDSDALGIEDDGEIDLVLISHFNDDHCHAATIKQIGKHVPVITTAAAAKKIDAYNHFDTSAIVMPDLTPNNVQSLWQQPQPSQPPWLRIAQIPSQGPYPYLHWATFLTYAPEPLPLPSTASSYPETILYSPHGIYASRLSDYSFLAAAPSQILCLLHGLDPATSPQQADLGVQNGWAVARATRAKYWVPTHDEHLAYTGVIGWFQKKLRMSFADVVRGSEDEVVMREVGNGESFVLA